MGMGGQRHAQASYRRKIVAVPMVQEAGCAPRLVWAGTENLASYRNSIPGPSSP